MSKRMTAVGATTGIVALLSFAALPTSTRSEAATAPPDQGVESSSKVSFDQPPTASDIARVKQVFGGDVSTAEPKTDATVVTVAGFKPVGYKKLSCRRSYSMRDGNGTYTIQRACGSKQAPWGFKLSPQIRAIVAGKVRETGMAWWHIGKKKGTQAPHLVPPNYQFHGTYNPVRKRYYIRYHDKFYFRHKIGPGGNAQVTIKGKWYFYNG